MCRYRAGPPVGRCRDYERQPTPLTSNTSPAVVRGLAGREPGICSVLEAESTPTQTFRSFSGSDATAPSSISSCCPDLAGHRTRLPLRAEESDKAPGLSRVNLMQVLLEAGAGGMNGKGRPAPLS